MTQVAFSSAMLSTTTCRPLQTFRPVAIAARTAPISPCAVSCEGVLNTRRNTNSLLRIPTLYYVSGDTFTEVPVFRFSSYYVNAFAEIPILVNFAMISGNASAQTQGNADFQHPNNFEWFCEDSVERESDITKFPTSTRDQNLKFSLVFPNCVNPNDILQHNFSDAFRSVQKA